MVDIVKIKMIVGLCVLCLFLYSCSYRFGHPPRVKDLSSLKPGLSTAGDILLTLGEPRGRGLARLSADMTEPRDIWFYEYIETDSSDINMQILLVFLLDGVYDGHLWFDSSLMLRQQEG